MRLSLLAFAAAASAFAVATITATAARADDAAVAAEHAPVVQARQAGFKLQLAAFLGIKAAIARGDDVKTLALPAGAISGWGKAIPAMFPPGSAGGAALPTIWTDRAGFQAAAAELSSAAGKLAELAKAGDTEGFKAQYAVVGKACQDCHSKYLKAQDKH